MTSEKSVEKSALFLYTEIEVREYGKSTVSDRVN